MSLEKSDKKCTLNFQIACDSRNNYFLPMKKKIDAKLLCESKISNEMTKLSFNVVHLVTIFRFLYYFYCIVIRYYKILSSSDDKCSGTSGWAAARF